MMPFRSRYFRMRQRRRIARQIVILGSGEMAVKLLEEIEYMGRGPMVAGIVAIVAGSLGRIIRTRHSIKTN